MTRVCALCNKIKPMLGGKLLHVLGMRRWVCIPCHAQRIKAKND